MFISTGYRIKEKEVILSKINCIFKEFNNVICLKLTIILLLILILVNLCCDEYEK